MLEKCLQGRYLSTRHTFLQAHNCIHMINSCSCADYHSLTSECDENDPIWPLKQEMRCNTSNPDCNPAESNDWSRDLPPWAIGCNVYCITFCKHLRGALSTRTPGSISLYFISTLLVYSYVNFLSQITVLTFSSMTSSSRDSVRIMCYVFYVSLNHFKYCS